MKALRYILGTCLVLLTFALSSNAAISYVNGASSATASVVINITSGSHLLVVAAWANNGTASITFSDNINSSWPTPDKSVADTIDGVTMAVAHYENHGTGNTTITASTTAGAIGGILVHEYSGAATASALDVVAGQYAYTSSGGGSITSTNTASTAGANELVFGVGLNSGGPGAVTRTTGYTTRLNPTTTFASEDKDSGSIGVQAASFDNASSFQYTIVIAAVYKTGVAGLTEYYVDPDYTGGTRNGTSTNPWLSLTDGGATTAPWTVINTQLASGPVTVYFTARKAASDTNQTSTTQVLLDRTDTSTNLLTLDGRSKYNTVAANPIWAAYSGSSKFQVTASYPFNSDNSGSPYTQRNYVTLTGFRIVATEGQIMNLTGMSHLTVTYNEMLSSGSPTTGPGLIIGESNEAAHNWSSHVTLESNTIHDTYGECIYVGASSNDPPGPGGTGYSNANGVGTTVVTGAGTSLTVNIVQGQAPSPAGAISTVTIATAGTSYAVGDLISINGGTIQARMAIATIGGGGAVTALKNQPTGDDIYIHANTIYDCAAKGGQGDGIDVKDGNSNVRIVGNTFYHTAGFTPPIGGGNYCDCQGITTDGTDLIEGNFIHDWKLGNSHNAIVTTGAWNNPVGRTNSVIRNNIVASVTADGIKLDGPAAATYQWSGTKVYNNTVLAPDVCVENPSGDYHVSVDMRNNVCRNPVTNGYNSSAARLTTHDYNSWSGVTNLVVENGTTYTAATLTTWEAHSLSSDPLLVSTGTPYLDTNFKLQAGSPVRDFGTTLTGFSADYFGTARPTGSAWDMGATEYILNTNRNMLLRGIGN